MHGIIVLNPVGAGQAPAKKYFEKAGASPCQKTF